MFGKAIKYNHITYIASGVMVYATDIWVDGRQGRFQTWLTPQEVEETAVFCRKFRRSL